MLNHSRYVAKAKKEANNYLKLTAEIGIIRSRVCLELAHTLLQLDNHAYSDMLAILRKYSAPDITPAPLKGCHRHFHEKIRTLHRQIRYDQDLQHIIDDCASAQKPLSTSY